MRIKSIFNQYHDSKPFNKFSFAFMLLIISQL